VRSRRWIALAVAALAWAVSVVNAQSDEIPTSHPAIQYSQATNDPVAVILRDPKLLARLESADRPQLLKTLLDALSIRQESQMLVFLSASLQQQRINEGNPRAIYFNDSVSVGWVRGGFIEIASQDPTQGTVFYTAGASPASLIVREDRCLQCHHNGRTEGVPGMVERTGHKRPLDQRWGGWYVTGELGPLRHLGNVDQKTFVGNPAARAPGHLASLERTFDTTGYLTPHSDVVALMVFEHQMQLMNLLTRIGWDIRVAKQGGQFDPQGSVIRERLEQVVDYMLFVDEAPIPARIDGSTQFAAGFSSRGPRDTKGRSLYQLDLTRRLMRYPCSYMIYSEQFDQLPAEAKTAIARRLWAVLSGDERDRKYQHLSQTDRTAIIEILRETKPGLRLGPAEVL
jgi:hypothetical protein